MLLHIWFLVSVAEKCHTETTVEKWNWKSQWAEVCILMHEVISSMYYLVRGQRGHLLLRDTILD